MPTSLVTPEAYSDLCSTTVASGGYTAASGVLNVASTGSPFPQTQQFHIYIADATTKVVKAVGLVTAINSGTQWAVTMSTDANANQNDLVVLSLCAGAMDQIRADIQRTGSGSLPGTAKAGDIWRATDEPLNYRYSGSAWSPFGPMFALTNPTTPSWSWLNQGGSSVTAGQGSIYVLAPTSGSTNLRIRYTSAPSTPYTKTALLMPCLLTQNSAAGILFYDAVGGKLISIHFTGNSSQGNLIQVNRWNSATSYNSTPLSTTQYSPWSPCTWLQIGDDGTNLNFSLSTDGQNFIKIYSETETAFLANKPNKVGFFVDCESSTIQSAATLLSWA